MTNGNANTNEKENETQVEDSSNDLIYLSPALISEWFAQCLLQISQSPELAKSANNYAANASPNNSTSSTHSNGQLPASSNLGIPNILSCKKNPPGVTLILACGGTRIQ